MLKYIFDKIKDREWNWFKKEQHQCHVGRDSYKREGLIWVDPYDGDIQLFSLADLLANESWCKATGLNKKVKIGLCWGCNVGRVQSRKQPCECTYLPAYLKAFETLQQEGEEACIKYITETMI